MAGSAATTPAQLRTIVSEREARWQASLLVAAAVVAADRAASVSSVERASLAR